MPTKKILGKGSIFEMMMKNPYTIKRWVTLLQIMEAYESYILERLMRWGDHIHTTWVRRCRDLAEFRERWGDKDISTVANKLLEFFISSIN